MSVGWLEIAIIALVVMLVFGRWAIPDRLGDLATGLRSLAAPEDARRDPVPPNAEPAGGEAAVVRVPDR